MTASGLGQDGYLRFQKEVTYGTAIITSMTLVPVHPGTLITAVVENIDNANVIASRLKQAPNLGRKKVSGSIAMDAHPTLLGPLFNIFLGTSVDGIVSDSTYDHTWLMPVSGERIAKSFTIQQALGADLVDQFEGGKIASIKFTGDNKGQIKMDLKVIFEDYVEGAARISSFSYPTAIPYNFAFATLSVDPLLPTNDSEIVPLMNSFSLEIDLGYDLERFKMGSAIISNPVFNKIPTVMFSCNIDAEKVWTNYARLHETFKIVLTILSTEYAAGTTPFQTVFEIPSGRLKPETTVPGAIDRLTMDLEFDCGFGGTSTGSGSVPVMLELRHKDATAAYA